MSTGATEKCLHEHVFGFDHKIIKSLLHAVSLNKLTPKISSNISLVIVMGRVTFVSSPSAICHTCMFLDEDVYSNMTNNSFTALHAYTHTHTHTHTHLHSCCPAYCTYHSLEISHSSLPRVRGGYGRQNLGRNVQLFRVQAMLTQLFWEEVSRCYLNLFFQCVAMNLYYL